MGNPYNDVLDDRYRLRRVKVMKGDAVYTGILRIRGYKDNGCHLDDATLDGEKLGSVTVIDPDVIRLADTDGAPDIRTIHPENVGRLSYCRQTFDQRSFHNYVMETRLRGSIGSYPTVSPVGDTPLTEDDDVQYQVVEGHKRVQCAREAGIGPVPMVVVELSNWETALRFIDDHFPADTPHNIREQFGSDRSYSEAEFRQAIEALRDDWGDEKLRTHPGYRAVVAATVDYDSESDSDSLGLEFEPEQRLRPERRPRSTPSREY